MAFSVKSALRPSIHAENLVIYVQKLYSRLISLTEKRLDETENGRKQAVCLTYSQLRGRLDTADLSCVSCVLIWSSGSSHLLSPPSLRRPGSKVCQVISFEARLAGSLTNPVDQSDRSYETGLRSSGLGAFKLAQSPLSKGLHSQVNNDGGNFNVNASIKTRSHVIAFLAPILHIPHSDVRKCPQQMSNEVHYEEPTSPFPFPQPPSK